MINIVGLQIENQFDRDKNLERAVDWIHKIQGDVDLILLPELFMSGYSEKVFQKLDKISEDKTSYSFELFSQLAKEYKTYISFGFPEKVLTNHFGPEGFGPIINYYISQAVIDREGKTVGTYRKIHLAQFGDAVEKDYFTAGKKSFTFEIDEVKVGIATCYDFRFPEYIRKLALACEIDLLLHPSVFEKGHTFWSWHQFVATRSIENQIFVMSLNCGGDDYGYSVFHRPNDTRPKILTEGEGLLYGEVDLELRNQIREIYPLLKDRKLEF